MRKLKQLLGIRISVVVESALILCAGVAVQAILYGRFGWFRPSWWPLFCVCLLLAKRSRITRVFLFVILINYYQPFSQQDETSQLQVFKVADGLLLVDQLLSRSGDPDFYYEVKCYYINHHSGSVMVCYWRDWSMERPVLIDKNNGEYCLLFNVRYYLTITDKKIIVCADRGSYEIDLTDLSEIRPSENASLPLREISRIYFKE